MLHEDRILKSIDLLTYNARETLSKYSIWATTKDSSITFNLYDALPSYTNNGASGSAVFQKPITIPSFNSIATGIAGSPGTTSSRDLFWNFNFLSNGDGWVFDKYVQTNNGIPVNSGKNPVLQVKTDASFGVAGSPKAVNFIDSNISYTSPKSTLSLNDSNFLITTPLFGVYCAKNTSGIAEIASDIIMFGDRYSNPTNIPSSKIKMVSRSLAINGATQATTQYNILSANDGSITVGDFESTVLVNSTSTSIKYSQLGEFDISAIGNDTLDKINIIKSINTGLNSVDVYTFRSLGSSVIDNLVFGRLSSTSKLFNLINVPSVGLLGRFSALVNEGFQFVSKSKHNSSKDTSSVENYFDAWIDAGVDGASAPSSRKTPQYSIFGNGFVDPALATVKTNPYYFNLGTKGTLNILGGDLVNISSNSEIIYSVNNSPEVVIKKGSVVIPNLSLPQYSQFSLSTLRKSSYLRFNEQIKIFPFAQTKVLDITNTAPGMEICTDISNDRSAAEQDSLYIWSTFTHSEAGVDYYYSFYLVNDTADTYKLMCTRYLTTGNEIDYVSGATTTMVFAGIPKLEPDGSKFKYGRISVAASRKSVYVSFISKLGLWGSYNADYISLYVLSDLTTSIWTKIPQDYWASSFILKQDISVITVNDVACACGNKDKVWFALETEVNSTYFTPEVVCYNETSGKFSSIRVPSFYDNLFSTTSASAYKYEAAITIPATSTYNAYQYDSSAHIKIAPVFADNKFSAYITLTLNSAPDRQRHLISATTTNKLKLYKLVLDTTSENISIEGVTDLPAALITQGAYVYGVNKLLISETSAKHFSIHALLTKYPSGNYVDYVNGRINTVGTNYVLSWDETTAFNNVTVTSAGSLSEIADYRYCLDQVVGWVSDTEQVVRTLFTIDNNGSFNATLYSVGTSSLVESLDLTLTNMSTIDAGLVLPFGPRDLFIEKRINVQYVYDRTVATTVDFRVMQTKIDTINKSVNYVDQYAKYFSSAFIDAFGTSIYQNEIHSTLFSNVKTGKYSYSIMDYDASAIPGGAVIIENTNNGVIDDLMLVGNSSSVNYFQRIMLMGVDSTISSGVIININKDGVVIDENIVDVPVSMFAKCSILNELIGTTTMYRNGLLDRISNNSNNGINIGTFGTGYDKNVGYIPVELVSIFAKRLSQNNTDNILRSDFKITHTTTLANVSSSVTDLKYAIVEWNTVVNSGHEMPWIHDPTLVSSSANSTTIQNTCRDAYLIRDLGLLPYNQSFINKAYLIYDPTYNRTHVIMAPSYATTSPLFTINITTRGISAIGSVIIMSFDNKVINPFDKNFDATMGISNSANNVVSIRVDGHSTLTTKILNQFTNSNLMLGYTETNYVESSC